METVRVEYIGDKPIKEDNIASTGAVWLGHGDVQPVPLAAWPRLAPHTGVWRLASEALAGTRTLATAPAPSPIEPPVPAPAPTPTGVVALYGANLPALIDIDGVDVQLGTIVAAAHEVSGLTPEAWNALSELDRQERIEALIAQARAEAVEDRQKAEAAAKPPAAVEAAKPLSYEELKTELTKAGVDFPKQAKKVDLQALYDDLKAKG